MSAAGLSVVVANATSDGRAVAPAVAALAREFGDDGAQIVWVDRAGLVPEPPAQRFDVISAPADASRGDLYGLGLGRATGDVVAFTDSTTELLPGWRDAIESAFAGGARVIGGPVVPATPRSLRSWAGFLMEYVPHAVAPYTSATGDVSGNNVAYAASLLEDFRAGPVWKNVVNGRLSERGIRPTVVHGMRVSVRKSYGWRALSWDRIGHGRQFAIQRSATWTVTRRVAWALAAPLLPFVLFARLAAAAGRDATLRRKFVASAPAVLAAALCWSVGEAAGYLGGGSPRKGLL